MVPPEGRIVLRLWKIRHERSHSGKTYGVPVTADAEGAAEEEEVLAKQEVSLLLPIVTYYLPWEWLGKKSPILGKRTVPLQASFPTESRRERTISVPAEMLTVQVRSVEVWLPRSSLWWMNGRSEKVAKRTHRASPHMSWAETMRRS